MAAAGLKRGRALGRREHAADVHRTSCTYRPALVDDVVCPGNDVPPVPFRDKPSAVTRALTRTPRSLVRRRVAAPTRAVPAADDDDDDDDDDNDDDDDDY